MAIDDYSDLFSQAEQKYNLPAGVLQATAMNESSGDPSKDGVPTKYGTAQGLMQLLPDTAAGLGVKDPYDPTQAIEGGAKLLRQNLDKYGNLNDALMAYHGGDNKANWGDKTKASAANVQKIMSASDDPLVAEIQGYAKNNPTPIPTSKAPTTNGEDPLVAEIQGYNNLPKTPPTDTAPPVSTGEDLTRSYASGAANVVKNLPQAPAQYNKLASEAGAYIGSKLQGLTPEQTAANIKNATNTSFGNALQKAGDIGSNALSAVGTAAAPYIARGVNAFDNMIGQGNPNLTAEDINDAATAKDAPISSAAYQPQTDIGKVAKVGTEIVGGGALYGQGPLASLGGYGASEMTDNPLAKIALGAIGGGVGKLGENALGGIGNVLNPKAVPTDTANVVVGAKKQFGIDTPASAITGGNNLAEKLADIPDYNQWEGQVNKAAADLIGANDSGENHTTISKQAVLDARENTNAQYDALHDAIGPVNIENHFNNISNALDSFPSASSALVKTLSKNIVEKMDENGNISSADIKKLTSYKSTLQKAANSGDVNVSEPAGRLVDSLKQAVRDQATPEQAAQLDELDNKRNLVAEFEGIAAKSGTGNKLAPETIRDMTNKAYSNPTSSNSPNVQFQNYLNTVMPPRGVISPLKGANIRANSVGSNGGITPWGDVALGFLSGNPATGLALGAAQKILPAAAKNAATKYVMSNRYKNKLLSNADIEP